MALLQHAHRKPHFRPHGSLTAGPRVARRLTALALTLLATLTGGCAEDGQGGDGRDRAGARQKSAVFPEERDLLLFDGFHLLADYDAAPFECRIVAAPPDDEHEREAAVEFRDASGRLLLRWVCTWMHSFRMREGVVYRVEYDHNVPLGPWTGSGQPHRNGVVVAVDLARGGVELWRMPIPALGRLPGLGGQRSMNRMTRAALRFDPSGDLYLAMSQYDKIPRECRVALDTGRLGPPMPLGGGAGK